MPDPKPAGGVLAGLIEAGRIVDFEEGMPMGLDVAIEAGIGEIRRLLDIIDRASEALGPGANTRLRLLRAVVRARAILAEADPGEPGGEPA
jgi:hypothetical protein